jgi:hypothetical protein
MSKTNQGEILGQAQGQAQGRMLGQEVSTAREIVVNVVMRQLEGVMEGLESTEERLADKLQGVMRADNTPLEAKNCNEVDEEYPPLFDTMRSMLYRIERATRRINALISRTEL